MKSCQYCGKELLDEAVICPGCGCPTSEIGNTLTVGIDKSISAGLVVLAALVPLFGLFYWPTMAKLRPRCARVCGIVSIVAWLLAFVALSLLRG